MAGEILLRPEHARALPVVTFVVGAIRSWAISSCRAAWPDRNRGGIPGRRSSIREGK